MKLNAAQLSLFWRLWAAACRAQGWDAEHGLNSAAVNARRKEFLASLGFTSLTEVDRCDGFSLVKRELLKLDDRISGAMEEVNPQLETARKTRWFIEHDLLPCIALYADVEGVFETLADDERFCWRMGLPRRARIVLDDLTGDPVFHSVRGALREFPSQLEQLRFALARVLNGKGGLRAQAGESLAQMRHKAGVDSPPTPAADVVEDYDPESVPF